MTARGNVAAPPKAQRRFRTLSRWVGELLELNRELNTARAAVVEREIRDRMAQVDRVVVGLYDLSEDEVRAVQRNRG